MGLHGYLTNQQAHLYSQVLKLSPELADGGLVIPTLLLQLQ